MPDPYTGTGWTDPTGGGGMPPSLLGTNPAIPNAPNQNFGGSTGSVPNPGGYGSPAGSGEIQNNIALENLISGAFKNTLAPQWASLFSKYGGDAASFFSQMMNLGSPFYKQKQAEGFTSGVGQNQNAMADATQRLRSMGYGSTPSGANAAMIGGEEAAGASSLAEQYLQNLFQNENLQLQGAQGMMGVASLFNPAQLLGTTSSGINYQKPTSGWQQAAGMLSAINPSFSAGGGGGVSGGVGG